MHLAEEARERGTGDKKGHIHESWGYTETSQAAPCEETGRRGKVLKTWQSETQLTHSHPEGQAIVS